MPLPGIGQQVEKCIRRRTVKRDTYGRTTSVSFDVDFAEQLNSEAAISKMPRRLRRMPSIMHEAFQAR